MGCPADASQSASSRRSASAPSQADDPRLLPWVVTPVAGVVGSNGRAGDRWPQRSADPPV